MAKAFINDENLTDIADAIRATLDESRQYLPSEMAAAIQSVPIMAQLNRKKYFQSVPAGAASGYATIEQIEGNTVAWNQLIPNSYTPSLQQGSGVTLTNNGDGTYTANGTASGQVRYRFLFTLPRGHVILVKDDKIENGSLSSYFINFSEPATTSIYTRGGSIGTTTLNTNNVNFQLLIQNGVTVNNLTIRPQLFDLTAIFGAGNEPTTVAEFEAWLAQNIGTLPYYDYNAGELLSCKMSGMQTEDSSQQTIDTIALDVTTITGINTATNVREVIFADGMKQADYTGTVKDTLDLRSDTATVNVGSRAYQSGDESDPDVLTDGTITYYALTTPIEYTDLQDANGNPLNPRYKVEQGGTEQVLPVNTSTPTTVAPTLSTIYKKNV